MKTKTIFVEIISFLFIILFVYAALTKLVDHERFSVQIQQSALLQPFSELIVWLVPLTEIVIAAMLMIFRFRLLALYLAFSLMVIFTSYIVVILNFVDRVPCSCGGILEKMGWTEHLVFNSFFVLIAFGAIRIMTKSDNESYAVS